MKLSHFTAACVLLLIAFVGHSQTHYKAIPNDENSILIEGTSNIHDWEIVAEDYTSDIDLAFKDGNLEQLNSIALSIPVKGFDSGKGKMNKNTYKALDADTYKLVSFTSSMPTMLVEKSPGVYQGLIEGKLTISGTTNMIQVPVEFHKSATGYILKAEQPLNMLDYKVEPPSALFGTITTGETVNVIFDLTHYKS